MMITTEIHVDHLDSPAATSTTCSEEVVIWALRRTSQRLRRPRQELLGRTESLLLRGRLWHVPFHEPDFKEREKKKRKEKNI